MKRHASTWISSQDKPTGLLDFLGGRFTYHTRNAWEKEIRAGRVLVNGQAASSSATLKTGDLLEYVQSDTVEPRVDRRYSILHEDKTLLVVEKPPNLPCHPGGRYFRNTLWSLLKSEYSLDPVYFVNRIDRETSGIVLIAKNRAAADHCRRQFLAGTPKKHYLVVVEGHFHSPFLFADGFMGRDMDSLIRKKQKFFPKDAVDVTSSKPITCRTVFRLIQTQGGRSLLLAEPLTGRMHQIRATLCSMGYPVTGDKIYGTDETIFLRFIEGHLSEDDRLRLLLPRQALHASSLELNHPQSGKRVRFFSRLPEDMAGLF